MDPFSCWVVSERPETICWKISATKRRRNYQVIRTNIEKKGKNKDETEVHCGQRCGKHRTARSIKEYKRNMWVGWLFVCSNSYDDYYLYMFFAATVVKLLTAKKRSVDYMSSLSLLIYICVCVCVCVYVCVCVSFFIDFKDFLFANIASYIMNINIWFVFGLIPFLLSIMPSMG